MISLCMVLSVFAFEPLTVDDVVSAFRQHALTARTLRVEWSVTQKMTDAVAARAEAGLQEMKELKRQAVSDAEKMQISQAETRIQETLNATKGPLRDRYYQMDFWTDRRNFQSRCSRDDKTGAPILFAAPGSLSFPDEEATGEALRKHFSKIHVTSFGPASENRFRVWLGKELFPGVPNALIQTEKSRDLYRLIPPLVLPDPAWNGEPHPIDRLFMAATLGSAELLGSVTVNGRKTLLIQAIHNGYCFRGFIDVERGMMPLRVEWTVCSNETRFRERFNAHVDICETHPELIVGEICRDIELEELVTDGGQTLYYPVRGTTQRIQRWPHSVPTNLAFSKIQQNAAVERVDTWTVSRVEIDRPMSQENFAMTFPSGTCFIDSDTRESFVAGDMGDAASRFVAGAIQSVGQQPWYRRMGSMALVVVALAGISVGAWFFRRRAVRR